VPNHLPPIRRLDQARERNSGGKAIVGYQAGIVHDTKKNPAD
jgi:hypothetical protein